MAIACISVPHFALRIELLDRPELDGVPLVLSSPSGRRNAVDDCTPEASVRGIRLGMSLREVTALCPEAVIVFPNPVRDAVAFERIIDRLEAISPLVDPVEPGCCYVDLRGLGRLYGSPAEIAARLLRAIPPILRPRAGIAPGTFTSRLAAWQAPPGESLVIPPAEVTAFLAGLPVERLPLPLTMLRRLERLGLRTLGEFAALPLPAVQAQFGPEGRHAWNLARGRDSAQIYPRVREETVTEELTLPAPATNRGTLLIALRQLIIRAFGRPVLRSRNVRQARLRARIEGNRSWEQVMTLHEPAGRERLIEILNHRLQSAELPGPLEALTLDLTGLTAETARQETLLGSQPRRPRQLAEAIRQLKQRYGVSPLYRVVEVEPWSRIPERRRVLVSYDP